MQFLQKFRGPFHFLAFDFCTSFQSSFHLKFGWNLNFRTLNFSGTFSLKLFLIFKTISEKWFSVLTIIN